MQPWFRCSAKNIANKRSVIYLHRTKRHSETIVGLPIYHSSLFVEKILKLIYECNTIKSRGVKAYVQSQEMNPLRKLSKLKASRPVPVLKDRNTDQTCECQALGCVSDSRSKGSVNSDYSDCKRVRRQQQRWVIAGVQFRFQHATNVGKSLVPKRPVMRWWSKLNV